MSTICRFIHVEKANYPVTLLCKAMKTARSTYYAWAAGIEAREAGGGPIRPWPTRSR
ncbi:hypothetical protein ACFYN3_42135 [Streptomyces lavendulae]|uniref:hypothetical protein n=1 Tax=Streptomyces lavendulae TaxID=1914 RepID=UPI0033DD29C9